MRIVRVDKFELQGSPAKLSAVWKAVIRNLHSTNWSARYWKYAQKYSFVNRHLFKQGIVRIYGTWQYIFAWHVEIVCIIWNVHKGFLIVIISIFDYFYKTTA